MWIDWTIMQDSTRQIVQIIIIYLFKQYESIFQDAYKGINCKPCF